ncbi:MAG: endonuclease/exonuclease/phosphatase family protein [Bacteroidales bacterium]|nr:endonuclease/exonuclease/phosphatase family protein [Bacteroidales bacterium]
MKRILFLMMVAACTLGATAAHPKSYSTDASHPGTVKVMSFNMRSWMDNDTADMAWPRRLEPCRQMFIHQMPDLVGTQELRASMLPAAKTLLPGYGCYAHPQPADATDKQTGQGVIFYRLEKFEPLDSGFFWLSATPDVRSRPWNSTDHHYRSAAWMKLRDRSTGQVVWFVTTHLPYKKDPVDTEVRAKCCQLIIDQMTQIAGRDATVFVTGDMNASHAPTDTRRASVEPFFQHMHSARDEARVSDNQSSFNGYGRVIPGVEGKNLDHIFYWNAEPLVFETLNRPIYGPVRWISDHYPIITTFIF